MALDTQQKRMSAAGAGRPWMRAVFPVATPTGAWRLNVGLSYAGNAVTATTILDLCGPLHSGLVDPNRLTGFVDAARDTGLVDANRLSGLSCL